MGAAAVAPADRVVRSDEPALPVIETMGSVILGHSPGRSRRLARRFQSARSPPPRSCAGAHSQRSVVSLACLSLYADGVRFRRVVDESVDDRSRNFVSLISFSTTSGFASLTLSRAGDYLVWYAKDKTIIKYRQLYNEKAVGEEGATKYKPVRNYKSIPENWWPDNKLVSVD